MTSYLEKYLRIELDIKIFLAYQTVFASANNFLGAASICRAADTFQPKSKRSQCWTRIEIEVSHIFVNNLINKSNIFTSNTCYYLIILSQVGYTPRVQFMRSFAFIYTRHTLPTYKTII